MTYDVNMTQVGNGNLGALTVASGTHSLTSNSNYTSVTVDSGATLNTCGYILRVTGELVNYGTITDTCHGGTSGQGGNGGGASGAGTAGAAGGAGSSSNGFSGGSGGQGGGGGGGGSSNCGTGGSGGAGGNGGAGGGVVIVYANNVQNFGAMEADGANGNSGSNGNQGGNAAGGGGGGGSGSGGNGGTISFFANTLIGNGPTANEGLQGSNGSQGAGGSGCSTGAYTTNNGGTGGNPNGGAGGSAGGGSGSAGGANGGGGGGGTGSCTYNRFTHSYACQSGGGGGGGGPGTHGSIGSVLLSPQSFKYDTKTVTDENHHVIQYGYDWVGNLIWIREYNVTGGYYQTTYSYDLVGNQLSMTDPDKNVTSYQYDNLNRLKTTVYPDGTNATNTYNSVGSLINKKDQIGNIISYSYDALNRLTLVTYPDKSTVSYAYDNDGNRVSMLDNSSSTYYSYDAKDRLTNQTEIIAGTKYSTLYSYDKASNIVMQTYPNNYKLNYSYDFLNRVSAVGSLASFSYTLDNKINSISYTNGVKTAYTFNSRDLPTRILSTSGVTKLLDLNYTYDGVGNVLSIDSEKYSYDSLNRISSGNGSWGTIVYSYDPNGNMLKLIVNGVQTVYGYGSNNKLLTAGAATLSYNANGDLIKKVNGSTTFNYNYDYENRLKSLVENGATLQNNTYNADGQRIKNVAGSSSQIFLYEGSSMLESISGNSTSNMFYANGLLIGEISGASSYYYHEDALGNIRLVTASSGSVVFSSNYLPFGAGYSQSGSFLTPFRYTGKFDDYSTTGLYYFGARYYDPAISRFITLDTTKGSLVDPLSLNRYIYARDNPEAIIDPTGHDWFSSLTSAVSNAVSSVSNAVTQAASSLASTESSVVSSVSTAAEQTGSAIVNALSNPETQAIALTVGIDAGTAIAVAATGGTILLTPAGGALVGAAISTTAYTLTHEGRANGGGAIGAAVSGAIAGAFSGGTGALGLGVAGGVGLNIAGSVTGDIAGSFITSEVSGTAFAINPSQILVNAAISGLTYNIGDNVGGLIGSDVGRPATRLSTLARGVISPFDHPRAAYQAYSFLFGNGAQFGVPFAEDWFERS